MKRRLFTACFMATFLGVGHAQGTEEQIALALLALPESYRNDATVVTWNETGKRVVLRPGTNGWTCRADDPSPGILIQCHYKSWDALGTRIFGLIAEGKSRREAWAVCESDVKAGKLPKPERALVFELVGTNGANAQPLILVFLPYATGESLGLPTEPDNNHPWVMASGRINAHIMAH
jgi:hypothetical protein